MINYAPSSYSNISSSTQPLKCYQFYRARETSVSEGFNLNYLALTGCSPVSICIFKARTALKNQFKLLIRYNPLIQAFVKRLEAKGKHTMVIIAAVMRKLLHIAYGVLKNKKAFDPEYSH